MLGRKKGIKRQEVIGMYLSGKTQEEISKHLCCSQSNVCYFLKTSKIKTRIGKQLNSKLIMSEYLSGKTTPEIGKALSCSPQAIMYVLKKQGIKLRPSGWRGGKKFQDGYKHIYDPKNEMANRSGYVPEHRLVMAKFLNRPLKKSEQVHHINGNKLDNRIANLKIMFCGEHSSFHNSLLIKPTPVSDNIKKTNTKQCSFCKKFLPTDKFTPATKKPFFQGPCRDCRNAERRRRWKLGLPR